MTKRRWLPPHVYEYADRHGKRRYRYMRKGASHHFKSAPGTAEFMAELAGLTECAETTHTETRFKHGTIDDLCVRLYRSTRWAGIASNTQAVYRKEIDRFRVKYGGRMVRDATVADLDRILAKMKDTPSAANNLRKRLRMLFEVAVKMGWRTDNPVAHTDRFKESGGYHTWTDGEIEQYRTRHNLGTQARLAMELALACAARRCDVVKLSRSQLAGGKFRFQHAKGNNEVAIPASPEALDAIRAMPATGIGAFLVTSHGRPYSVAGLGNAFRQWCSEARLPHCTMHGLRKAQSRRLAESGATSLQGRAITGHTKDSTFAYYAEMADRERMAEAAFANLASHNLLTSQENG